MPMSFTDAQALLGRSQGSSALTCFLSAALIYAVELLGPWNNGTPEADSPNLDPVHSRRLVPRHAADDAGYTEDVGAIVKMLADERIGWTRRLSL
ncbi:hypothetical protein DFH07DRAFT_368669 [Mycena maculata]|uniref:Uncharacterized protein n=1 Tax=Mycena maculata TaxID=230809 RepID=A0AAD7H989_9AGAR|nr:hypothetical protein DFH07DRAFT_368669 [Mycena maculata]